MVVVDLRERRVCLMLVTRWLMEKYARTGKRLKGGGRLALKLFAQVGRNEEIMSSPLIGQ